MAAQQGFQYELNAADVLKNLDPPLVPREFRPAGAGHDQPDLMIMKGKETSGCELKITAASAGSLVLKYDGREKKWKFGDIRENDEEKIFLRDLAAEINLFDKIAKEWKDVPLKRENDPSVSVFTKGLTKKQIYEYDKARFKDIRGEIPANKIEQYYNKKKTYYVNVGTHGFYLMGTSNPLKLTGVPTFSQNAVATYRARVQYKGNDSYQFTFEMQFSMKNKSPYNIAPVDGKSVNILKDKLSLGCFF